MFKKRMPMKKTASKKHFRKNAGHHGKNQRAKPMRGGYRL